MNVRSCLSSKINNYVIRMLFVSVFASAQAHAGTIGVAVIETKDPNAGNAPHQQLFKEELKALFKDQQDLNFIPYGAPEGATLDDINVLLDQAYDNPNTDLILVLDLAANQMAGNRNSFEKPTFLPLVFNGQLLGYPVSGTSSGKTNLSYLTRELNFETEINTLHRVAPFTNAVLLVDERVYKTVDSLMSSLAKEHARQAGAELTIQTYNGDAEDFLSHAPAGIDAVLYGPLSTADRKQMKRIIQGINAKNIVSFALHGEENVRLGAFAGSNPDTDWKKLARKTAIYIQDVFLGMPAEELPIFFETSTRLMINMETSRIIGYSPRFDVLLDAILINEDEKDGSVVYSISDVAHKAVNENLSLAAQRLQTESALEAIKEVRGGLLPRLDSSITYSTREETALTRNGALAESSIDGSLTITQPLFSETRWAAYAIKKYSHLSEQEALRETELDIIRSAVNAYLNVLKEKSTLDQSRYNLAITRQNYQLAKNRVNAGSSNASDLYRWESELANAKRSVLVAQSYLDQKRQGLNAILNRPIKEQFKTTVETLDNPFLLISDTRIRDLITNPYSLQRLADFLVEQGLKKAPELRNLEAQIASQERQFKSYNRAFWLPDLNLKGEYATNFDETRSGGTSAEDNEWTAGLELSLLLFEGGSKSARKAQSRLTASRLQINYRDERNSIEQKIRNEVIATHASYLSIALAQISEEASQKNYDLVAESYAEGEDSIADVLDAQEALIEAREASMNSVYNFLIDLMNLQRAGGAFDFFLTTDEHMAFYDNFRRQILSK